MKPFMKIAEGLDTGPLQAQLAANPQLWDQFEGRRTSPGSPHSQMTDIWVRYGEDPAKPGPHVPIWYPAAELLPAIRQTALSLVGSVRGEMLGGILITRLPPGGRIARHTDGGWHAGYYEKFYVAINAPKGAAFCWDDGVIEPSEGDIWWFRNDLPHWVVNDSQEDRLAGIVCIRTDNFRDQK